MNVEAQNDANPGYPIVSRGSVYTAGSIVSQCKVEYDFYSYGAVKKVYSIWLILQAADYLDGCINYYSSKEICLAGDYKEEKENYDKQVQIVVYIAKNHKIENKYEKYDDLLTPLYVLFTTHIKDVEEKKKILSQYNYNCSELEGGIRQMCNLSKGVLQEGIEQGIKLGKTQGMEQGEKNEKIRSIQILMETLKCSFDQATFYLQIPASQIEEYRLLCS